MRPKVYLETTIPSYLTAWPSRDLIIAAHQQITQQWWSTRKSEFDLFISQPVLDECSEGDEEAAARRLAAVSGIPLLSVTDKTTPLAESLLARVPLPPKAAADALHIAVAAEHGMDYLLTWNCAHIANAVLRPRIEAICREAGFAPPIICTPEELFEE